MVLAGSAIGGAIDIVALDSPILFDDFPRDLLNLHRPPVQRIKILFPRGDEDEFHGFQLAAGGPADGHQRLPEQIETHPPGHRFRADTAPDTPGHAAHHIPFNLIADKLDRLKCFNILVRQLRPPQH